MLRISENPAIDTAGKLVGVAVLMFAFVFVVMVPLYDVLCDALGINGKTSSEAYTSVPAAVDESRTVSVQFLASNHAGMPWSFSPDTTVMRVHPGAVNETVYHAHNIMPAAMVGQAVPSVSPSRAAPYLHKTECFCFNHQPLDAGATAELPIRYIVDQDLPKDIKTITLSYTLFDITNAVSGSVAAR